MKDHSWIDFEWEGKKYRYKGEWPKEIRAAIGASMSSLCLQGKKVTRLSLLMEAGAKIIEVHSVRPDGSIRVEDLPEYYVH